MTQITVTKVVTRNFIMDLIAGVQNFFGLNLTSYEKMITKGMQQIQEEIIGKKLNWYRYGIITLRERIKKRKEVKA